MTQARHGPGEDEGVRHQACCPQHREQTEPRKPDPGEDRVDHRPRDTGSPWQQPPHSGCPGKQGDPLPGQSPDPEADA